MEKLGDGRYIIIDRERDPSFEPGGQGKVLLGLDTHLGKLVVMKKLLGGSETDQIGRKRFLREAKTLAQADAGNFIVKIFDLLKDSDGNDVIVMEYVEGQDLFDFQNRSGWRNRTKSEKTVFVATLGMQACDALDYLHHELGYIHRDVKRENFIVTKNNDDCVVIKLIDFGLILKMEKDGTEAENVDVKQPTPPSPTSEERLTRGMPYMGTPQYCAPEAIRNYKTPREKSIDGRSDLYALGTTMYALLTGELPFGGSHYRSEEAKRKATPAPKTTEYRNVERTLAGIVDELLEDDPDKRPPDALALKQKIKEAMESGGYHLKNEFYSIWEEAQN